MRVTEKELKQMIKEEVLGLFEVEGWEMADLSREEESEQMSLPKTHFRDTRTADQTMGAPPDVDTGKSAQSLSGWLGGWEQSEEDAAQMSLPKTGYDRPAPPGEGGEGTYMRGAHTGEAGEMAPWMRTSVKGRHGAQAINKIREEILGLLETEEVDEAMINDLPRPPGPGGPGMVSRLRRAQKAFTPRTVSQSGRAGFEAAREVPGRKVTIPIAAKDRPEYDPTAKVSDPHKGGWKAAKAAPGTVVKVGK